MFVCECRRRAVHVFPAVRQLWTVAVTLTTLEKRRSRAGGSVCVIAPFCYFAPCSLVWLGEKPVDAPRTGPRRTEPAIGGD